MHCSNSNLLHAVFGTELPNGYSLLLIGLPGVGKTTFVRNVFREAVDLTRKGIYVALEPARRQAPVSGFPSGVQVAYLDGYSWKVGVSESKYSVRNLSNLSELSVKMMGAANEIGQDFFYVVDSLSNLAVYCNENEILRFLEVISSRYRTRRGTGLWAVEEGVHSEYFYNMLRHIVDGIMEMKTVNQGEELRRFVRLIILRDSFHSVKWLEFLILRDGTVEFKKAD